MNDTTKKTRVRNVNLEQKAKLTRVDGFAIKIARNVGTTGFFLIIFIWTIMWFLWNTSAPEPLRFDPFPAFVFWVFLSNMIQLFIMPLLLIGQNLEAKHAEARAEADYEVNVRAEKEIEEIVESLKRQDKILNQLLERSS